MKRTNQQNKYLLETWLPIQGYENIYSVSNYGRIKNDRKNNILKNTILSTGYLQINLTKNGKQKKHLVHRLVAIAFIPNPDNLPLVNHKDGFKDNPISNNLEWCTLSENVKHGYDVIGIIPSQLRRFGKNHNKSVPVLQKNKSGMMIKRWDSGMDAVRAGFDSSCISRCCSGENKTHKGYIWEYEKD